MFADGAGFPARGEESHHGDEREEENKNRERNPFDLTGHDDAVPSRSFVRGAAAIDQPDQH